VVGSALGMVQTLFFGLCDVDSGIWLENARIQLGLLAFSNRVHSLSNVGYKPIFMRYAYAVDGGNHMLYFFAWPGQVTWSHDHPNP